MPSAVVLGSNELQDFRSHNGDRMSHSVTVSQSAITCSFPLLAVMDIFFTFLNLVFVTVCHSVTHVMCVTRVACGTHVHIPCRWSPNVS
jgi:hypothetical protein